MPPNPKVKWDEWVGDYGLIRDLIAETYPDEFHDFNGRMWTPGGFYRGNSARERIWKTESGKAEFTTPEHMSATGFDDAPGRYRLITMRSNDQFNTTIYGYSDRLRGIEGTRDVLLINPQDMTARAGLREGQTVSLVSDAGGRRRAPGRRAEGHALFAARRMPRRLLSGDESAHPALESRPAIEDARIQVSPGADQGG